MSRNIVVNITEGSKKNIAVAAKPAIKAPVKAVKKATKVIKPATKTATKTKTAPAMADLAEQLKKLTTQFKEKTKAVDQAKTEFDTAKENLDALTKSADAIQTKIDAVQLKLSSSNLAKAGVTFLVLNDKKVVAKAKDLETAMKSTPKKGVTEAMIVAVAKAGGKSKVMIWSMKDPVTNRRFKGFSWFFMSEALLKKYGSPTTKRWLAQRQEAQKNGTLNPFLKKK